MTAMTSYTTTGTETKLQLQQNNTFMTMPHNHSLVPIAMNSGGGNHDNFSNNNNNSNSNNNNTVDSATQVTTLIPPTPQELPSTNVSCDGTIRVPSGSGYRIMTPFPWRLHEMLEEIEEKKLGWIVSWLPGGRAFQVHSPEKFSEDVIPKYFRHTRYKSFQRQLYLYGFRSLEVSSLSRGAYFHPFFVRENRSLCRFIERPKSTSQPSKSSTSSNSSTEGTKTENKRRRSRKATKKTTEEPAKPIKTQEQPAADMGPEDRSNALLALYTNLTSQEKSFSQVTKCDTGSSSFSTTNGFVEPLSATSGMWNLPNTISDGNSSSSRSNPPSVSDIFSDNGYDSTVEPLDFDRFDDRNSNDFNDSLSMDFDMSFLSPSMITTTGTKGPILNRLEPFSDDIINLFGGHYVTIG